MPETVKDAYLIRDMRKTDLNDLLELLPKCFAKENEATGFDPDHMRDMMNSAFEGLGGFFFRLAELFRREPVRLLVAEVGGRVVGTAFVGISGRIGYISTVMVHPDYRRRGIATALVKRAVEYVWSRGRERAVLHVDSTNAPAIGVYSKLGFVSFEQNACLVGRTDTIPPQAPASGVETRLYDKGDRDEVYDLIRVSGDPDHLRVYGFTKEDLDTPFWMRLIHFGTQGNLVATRSGKIVGYVEAGYTTPKEAGYVNLPEIEPGGGAAVVSGVLLGAALGEIRGGGVEKVRAMVSVRHRELIETLRTLGFADQLVLVGMFRETQHGK